MEFVDKVERRVADGLTAGRKFRWMDPCVARTAAGHKLCFVGVYRLRTSNLRFTPW